MSSRPVRIADGLEISGGAPLLLIAGPDLIESEEHAIKMALALMGRKSELNWLDGVSSNDVHITSRVLLEEVKALIRNKE